MAAHAAILTLITIAATAQPAAAKPDEKAAVREALTRRTAWLKGPRSARSQTADNHGKAVKVIHTGATWYGPGFHGRRTANGERFNRYGMTLASRHLPFGTRVRVVNPKTGKSQVARVNDRGPFGHPGYTVDLSQGLAQKIGFHSTGKVRLEILPKASPPSK